MLKFYFPKETDGMASFFEEDALRKSLIMAAEDEVGLLALCRFIYSGSSAVIQEIVKVDHSADMEIFDGLLRSVLFHLMEMGCHSVEVFNGPEDLAEYFRGLGFTLEGDHWHHDDFPGALFCGCPSCGGM
ncbi:hypothetical protein [Eubacterium aggregans]|uniref:hypothetical protein n=1 Tax=Eubacterium aggregans TaxID=81409 RepID=UPI0023F3AE30|nr:hypothetical protein [Eubacterium aggregans]MDD4691919.1 hypothetical protein [Eubacterium aggregans]